MQPETTIGQYRIVEPLGKGGMANTANDHIDDSIIWQGIVDISYTFQYLICDMNI